MTTCMMDSCSVTNNSTEARATRDKNNVETNNLTKEPNEKKLSWDPLQNAIQHT